MLPLHQIPFSAFTPLLYSPSHFSLSHPNPPRFLCSYLFSFSLHAFLLFYFSFFSALLTFHLSIYLYSVPVILLFSHLSPITYIIFFCIHFHLHYALPTSLYLLHDHFSLFSHPLRSPHQHFFTHSLLLILNLPHYLLRISAAFLLPCFSLLSAVPCVSFSLLFCRHVLR